ncbi:MAG: CehA/McbA family metallohydrolase [Gemmatimonadota bacterium]|nr:CehA/McbA family metallohydrolase [Gemmatimonadota bacterium]
MVAGSRGSWTVDWVAGESGMAEGGGVVLQVSPFWGWSPPRVAPPGAAGFTTVSCSREDVTLTLHEGAPPMSLVALLDRGRLAEGDTVRFVYGDTSGGHPGSLARADSYAEAFEELLIKTDADADGVFATVKNAPTLAILPAEAVRLTLAAPAVVEPGARVSVRVSALDRFGNRAVLPGGTLSVFTTDLAHPGEESADLPRAEDVGVTPGGRSAGVGLLVREAGLLRIHAVLNGGSGALRGQGDLLLVERDSSLRNLLWGDIHCHSALSDGTGSPRELLEFARDVAGLDVACVTDHDAHGVAPLDEAAFAMVRQATQNAYDPGRFATLLGYEWTSWTWGHRNVYFPGVEGRVYEHRDAASDTPQELWERVAPYGAMTIPHHPGGGPIAVDWSVPSPDDMETVVEICSIHGSSEAPGVPGMIYDPVPEGFVRAALDAGHRLGFLASGDTHDGHPGHRSAGAATHGLVAFRAAACTREAVWDAMRDRHVYGTTGARILLDTDWGGVLPGRVVDAWPAGALRIRVVSPEPVERIELVGTDGVVERRRGGGRQVTRRFLKGRDRPASPWLYVRVVLADGETAWESPWWTRSEGER